MINIILCTYNSNNAFLKKQLDSLFNQSYKKIKVFIFDDSTTNVAYNVFTYYKKKYRNRIFYKNGSKTNSFSDNFLTALKKIKIKLNENLKNFKLENTKENKIKKIILSSADILLVMLLIQFLNIKF